MIRTAENSMGRRDFVEHRGEKYRRIENVYRPHTNSAHVVEVSWFKENWDNSKDAPSVVEEIKDEELIKSLNDEFRKLLNTERREVNKIHDLYQILHNLSDGMSISYAADCILNIFSKKNKKKNLLIFMSLQKNMNQQFL